MTETGSAQSDGSVGGSRGTKHANPNWKTNLLRRKLT